MTERLYYSDAYLTHFRAVVLDAVEQDGVYHIRLDRSAFYPTSGGQPFDTGMLDDVPVTDVYVDEAGDVWHTVGSFFMPGSEVSGEINWLRRFDHMQQHAADHMIASALWRHMGGVTIGLHISQEVSTIDVAMPEGITRISPEHILLLEDDVNERIQRDVQIHCWFPKEEELKVLPLRKPPTVKDHVRIVAIGEDEMVACGGTHPSTAGQLGLVKILSVEPARGKMRVSFVAGKRAFDDYRRVYNSAHGAAAQLSTGVDQLESQVSVMQEELKQLHGELGRMRREEILNSLNNAIENAPRLSCGAAVMVKMLEGDAGLLKDVASRVIRRPGIVVLLGALADAGHAIFVFARSGDVNINMGQLLLKAAKPLGGKGGGRPDFAQGGGDPDILNAAEALLLGDSE